MSEPVTVRILDREYTVGVSDDERDSLTAAARMLDARMRELRGGNKMVAPDRLAVLTALNLAHELQQSQTPATARSGDPFALLDDANRKLDALLAAS
ncbi:MULTISPECIES: cell division protein ZapA [Thermomonas]|jgi:cell division protein ZapA|uniref:Cell division protein ZapA n=1 Tax=Thermomonas beijingensis TaxID=2872701 RepID=A0ABS7TF11_9GAMM|nr:MULTISPECIES: cell division protein ZapA [Thermomonas]MBS0458597.1 cell division protein ZapA [Pseudomonadota bacterium]MDE2381401.1 cell division protein ZapA [Xanthomonadaceae bacterium]MBZ4186455.1 cell division protein ZapA [Thermomonas beijingensis]HOC11705.1 cell division protein ZapA [Thermomonas sp.]HQA02620.1 cell division protein ZapA [Thermomonas sp.]